MIVVADTSPINYLVQIELDWLLHRLYGSVLMPREVLLELRAVGAPDVVREWAGKRPYWAHVQDVTMHLAGELEVLDDGERAAIELAIEVHATTILLDERKARRIVQRMGLAVTGTLGILRDSHRLDLVDARHAYTELCSRTSFRHNDELDVAFYKSLDPEV